MQQLFLAVTIPDGNSLADYATVVNQSNLAASLEAKFGSKARIHARLVPDYAYNGGTCCPHCGGEIEQPGQLNAEDGVAWRDCRCRECEKVWTEEYQLVDFEPVGG